MRYDDLSESNMTISFEAVAAALKKSESYEMQDAIRRFEDVAKKQPAVMGAAVQLGSLGVPLSLVEHALKILLVLFECFESEAPDLPSLKQEVVQDAFTRNTEALRTYATQSKDEAKKSQHSYLMNLKEYALVAFVTSYLQDNVRGISRETEMVRQCCWVMMDAYIVAYHAHFESKKGAK
jgi:hypothetical protein